jgi:hypothetical protein
VLLADYNRAYGTEFMAEDLLRAGDMAKQTFKLLSFAVARERALARLYESRQYAFFLLSRCSVRADGDAIVVSAPDPATTYPWDAPTDLTPTFKRMGYVAVSANTWRSKE